MSSHDEPNDRFMTTHWSLVIAAGGSASPQSHDALGQLCESYWYPLYAFTRRQGHSAADAQDLTQEFFSRVLEKNYMGDADRQRGKFRTFLMSSMKHFLANQRDRERAQKRGGGQSILSLDFESAERRYCQEPSHDATPEQLFDRRWALTLLDRVMDRLEQSYVEAGTGALFEALRDSLTREKGSASYQEVAEGLGMSEGAVKTAAHRLRKRYRRLLEQEIGHTVASPEEIEEELRELFAAVSRKN